MCSTRSFITEADRARLSTYSNDGLEAVDTYKLQYCCGYFIATHFGLRGRDVFAKMCKQDLVFKDCGDDEPENIKLSADVYTKNTPGGLAGMEFEMCGQIMDCVQVSALKRLPSSPS